MKLGGRSTREIAHVGMEVGVLRDKGDSLVNPWEVDEQDHLQIPVAAAHLVEQDRVTEPHVGIDDRGHAAEKVYGDVQFHSLLVDGV